ncbi:major facilitator superfamily permease [Streptomyces hygroscopicus subsp. jinggangensis 5008]|nr:major facilitator superfamily permease [Streptomyces hygroscopicus subsp. jinggangensis 5008]AGF60263.1 major facilitator superfamily permease [Streptomyces hygroscopicus subsp. jinggangensis TL01]
MSLLASSSAPTPLYAVYQARWGFSPITVTVVFGVYAVAVLVALLVFGKISDHVGRRPVLFVALIGQTAAMAAFISAGGVDALLAARVVQGLSTGAAVGALGAAMLDLDAGRGGFLNSFAPTVGTASGALVAGLIVQYLPAPTHLVYYVLLGVFVLQALALTGLNETVSRKPGALASMAPEFKLPRSARAPMAVAAPVMFAVWALTGLYGALGPALARTLVHSTSVVWGGLPLFVLAGSAGLAVVLLRGTATRRVMLIGIGSLVAGVVITLVSIASGTGGTPSVIGFFIGGSISGFGFGSGFQGGIRLVMPRVEPHERAGVLSLLYVVCYLGLGVPAVIGGVLVVHGGGLVRTSREYGVAVIVLALAALTALVLNDRRAERVAVVRPEAGRAPEAAPLAQSTCQG